MIVTVDYVAKIRVFHTTEEGINKRKHKCLEYLDRHGWTHKGGSCGSCEYQTVSFSGYCDYEKSFESKKEMDLEIKDIDCAFNNGWSKQVGAYNVSHREIEPYDYKQFSTT